MTVSQLGDHPAPFPKRVLDAIAARVTAADVVLDPFAGIGRIHSLADLVGCQTVGVEIEAEWAVKHRRTIVGDSRHLLSICAMYAVRPTVVATSPTYGNRMADTFTPSGRCRPCGGTGNRLDHEAEAWRPCEPCDGTGRRDHTYHTYTAYLGRKLTAGNSGGMQWGDEYRALHGDVWRGSYDVLPVGGRLLVNVKNHVRNRAVVDVVGWHIAECEHIGFDLAEHIDVKTGGIPNGENREAKAEAGPERLLVFVKAGA